MTLNAHYIGANNYQNSVNSDRKLAEYLSMGSSGISGVTPGSFAVGTVAGQHQVTVGGAGSRAFLAGKNTPASQGAYHAWADAAEPVNMPTPQSNPFIATVILRVTDPQYGTVTGLVGARIDVVSGTPASSPQPISDAAIDAISGAPGGWTRLADVRINTTDTGAIPVGQITDTRTFLPDRAGDPLQCLSTQRPVGVRGRTIFEIDTGRILIYDGTNWVYPNPVELVKFSDHPQASAEYTLTTSFSDVFSVPVTVLAGMPTVVEFGGYIFNGQSGAARTARVQYLVDGTAMGPRPQLYGDLIFLAGESPGYPIHYRRVYGPGELSAGVHTFKMQGLASNAASVVINSMSLSVRQGGMRA